MDSAIHISSDKLVSAFEAHENNRVGILDYIDPKGFKCECCGSLVMCINLTRDLDKCKQKYHFRSITDHADDCEINSAYLTYNDFKNAEKNGTKPPLLILDNKGLRPEQNKNKKTSDSDGWGYISDGINSEKTRGGWHRARNLFNLPIQRILEVANKYSAEVRINGNKTPLRQVLHKAIFDDGIIPKESKIYFGWAKVYQFDDGSFTYYFQDSKKLKHCNDGTAIYLKDISLLYDDKARKLSQKAVDTKEQVELIVYGKAQIKKKQNGDEITEIKNIEVMNIRPRLKWYK